MVRLQYVVTTNVGDIMMLVLIDGKEVECESIEFRNDDLIVGATCAGGYHQEIKGSSQILIEDDTLTASIAQYNPECGEDNIGECIINLDDLLQEMGDTVLRTKFKLDNKEFIETMENIFD